MKLCSCQIENFGKLQHLELQFQEGLNVFLRENGFGKSTLAAFIRVMFYGLSGERKAQDSENERKKYRPWQGGSFGGSLTFALENGKRYRITRSFGERKSQDRFQLYDAETNLPSKDYSERIGEELFQIDETSFRRTCFIGQQELETGVTSEINARIGNVSEDPEDMKRYQAVCEQLKDALNALSPHRRTGAIFKKRMELEMLKADCAGRDAEEQQAVQGAAVLHAAREQRKHVQSMLESTNRRLLQQSQQQDVIQDRLEYDRLCASRADCVERLLEQERRYLGADFDTLSGEQRGQRLQRDLRRLQGIFRDGVPSEADLQAAEQCLQRISSLSDRLLEQDRNAPRRSSSPKQQTQRTGAFLFLLLSVLLLLSGAMGLYHSMEAAVSFGLLAAGVLALLLAIRSFVRSTGTKSQDHERERTMESRSLELDRLNQALNRFLQRFYPEAELKGGSVQKHATLRNGRTENRQEDARPNRADLLRRLDHDVLAYHRLSDIQALAVELSKRQAAQNAFEQQHDMEKLAALKQPAEAAESLATLSAQLQELQKKLEALDAEIQHDEAEQEASEQRLNTLYEKERAAAQAVEALAAMEQRYQLLTLVRDHLAKARNDFTKEYMDPMMAAFTKYYRMLANASDEHLCTLPTAACSPQHGAEENGTSASMETEKASTIPFRMDADFNVHLLDAGEERSTELLSAGYRNLVELARRMAFVDAMYEEEKPFILLDDPFINLDPPKVEGGLRFLKAIAEEHQVIYFTCHESRIWSEAK